MEMKIMLSTSWFHGFQERTERWAGFPIWLSHQLWLVLETFTTSLSERFLHSLVTPARLSSRILPQVHLLKPQKVISILIYFRLHSTSNLTTWFFWTFLMHAVVLANICVTVGWATFLLGCLLSTFSPPFTVCFQEAFLYTKSRVKFQSRFLFWLSFDIFPLLGVELCAFVTHDVLCLKNFQVPHRLALLHCGHFTVNVTDDCITLFYFIMPETFLITFHIFSHI